MLYKFAGELPGVPAADTKQFIFSLYIWHIYGADLKPNGHSSNTQASGFENQQILSQIAEVKEIHQDVQKAGDAKVVFVADHKTRSDANR